MVDAQYVKSENLSIENTGAGASVRAVPNVMLLHAGSKSSNTPSSSQR